MNLLLGEYYDNEKKKIILLFPTYTVIAELKLKTYKSYEIRKFHLNEIKG